MRGFGERKGAKGDLLVKGGVNKGEAARIEQLLREAHIPCKVVEYTDRADVVTIYGYQKKARDLL